MSLLRFIFEKCQRSWGPLRPVVFTGIGFFRVLIIKNYEQGSEFFRVLIIKNYEQFYLVNFTSTSLFTRFLYIIDFT